MMKYEYMVTREELPPDAKSPIMDSFQMQDWLNNMNEHGWELVTYLKTLWNDSTHTQQQCIFRKLK